VINISSGTLFEVVSLILSGVLGAVITKIILKRKENKEIKEDTTREKTTKETTVTVQKNLEPSPNPTILRERINTNYTPTDFQDLVNYISDKYMLIDITLLTSEGLPIASNSNSPEEDAAIAPEILRIVGEIVKSDKIIISGKNEKILVFKIHPEVIAYTRVRREITGIEIEKLKEEITKFMEVYM